jgi:hypothetical protein
MGTVTNITSEDLEVSLLDHRIVKAGETVEVHDDLLHAHDESCGDEQIQTSTRENCDRHGFVWPETTWRIAPVTAPTAVWQNTDTAAADDEAQE